MSEGKIQLRLKLAVLAILGAGSLQATIITAYSGGMANPLYGPGGFLSPEWTQNFGTVITNPVPAAQGSLGTSYTNFSNINLTSSGGNLIYDPNGSAAAGCNLGKTASGGSLTGYTNCVGNYTLANTSTGTQKDVSGTTPTATSFSILYDVPVAATAFQISLPGVLNLSDNTFIQVYDVNHNLIDSSHVHLDLTGADAWVYITGESSAIGSVVVSSTNFNEANGGTWNFVLGNVQAAPEPGTMALLGLGLAGIGFVARRKAA
jgi:hypothetical protein